MRLLVTGATGKVGNAVARRLVERGDHVAALVRDVNRARDLLPTEVELVPGDVTDPASVREAARGAEGVFNCMGIYEQWLPDQTTFHDVNTIGALNVIAASRQAGVPRAVHTSTFDVFEAERGGTVREDRVARQPKGTAYERSKQRAEELVLGESRHGIEVVIVNPSAVYGPGPWARVGIDRVLRDAIRGRLPAVPPGGMTIAFVEDVAAAQLEAFERGRPGERYILADGFATNRELCALAVETAGRGRVPPTLPAALAKALATAGEGVSKVIRRPPLLGRGQLHFLLWEARADSTKAQTELDFRPTPWREGIPRTVRWMLDSGRA
ncbi:MAG TPA: NAD-dependent epimerase/dehydratase family protein [Solirubrobacterales bacterium]|jgi:dihydroflavonol-4-reductase|nr:NAD-dependent epimerase/dehydratase family protein [Solirubrobacterales bacterium]